MPDAVVQTVLERDDYRCQLCSAGGDNRLQLHHWFSFRSSGGPHIAENLVTVCFKCHEDIHAGRKDIVLVEVWPGTWAAFPASPIRRL